MLILLDTSALVWWMHNDSRLGPKARSYIADRSHQIVVSAISILEYQIKSRLKRLPQVNDFNGLITKQGFLPLSYSVTHAEGAYQVPKLSWKDPFDLAIIGTAKELERAKLLTSDRRILAELNDYISCIDAKK